MSVGFNGMNSLGLSAKDIQILAKYGLGATLVETSDDLFSVYNVPMMAMMGGQQIWPWLKQNKTGLVEGGNWFQNWGKAMANLNAQKEGTQAMQAIRRAAGNIKPEEGTKALFNKGAYGEALHSFRLSKITESLPDVKIMENLPKEINTKANNLFKEVEKAVAKGDLATAETKLATLQNITHGHIPTPFFGKFAKFVGKYSGYSSISGWVRKVADEGSPLLRKALPCLKGAGVWTAISSVTELFNIIPAFAQGGIGSGFAQIGKSAVKTAANIAGWFGGEAVGSSVGAVIGTALLPGVGTVAGALIGGLCGLVGGFVGSWAAGKVAQKIVGKDEPELIKERNAQKLTQQAMVDPTVLKGILSKVNDRLQSEGDSADTRLAFQSLQKMGISVDPSQPTQIATGTQAQQAAPSFKGNPYQMAYNYSNANPMAELMLNGSYDTEASTDPFNMAVSNAISLRPAFSARA